MAKVVKKKICCILQLWVQRYEIENWVWRVINFTIIALPQLSRNTLWQIPHLYPGVCFHVKTVIFFPTVFWKKLPVKDRKIFPFCAVKTYLMLSVNKFSDKSILTGRTWFFSPILSRLPFFLGRVTSCEIHHCSCGRSSPPKCNQRSINTFFTFPLFANLLKPTTETKIEQL